MVTIDFETRSEVETTKMNKPTIDDITNALKNPRYGNDFAFTEKTDALFTKYFSETPPSVFIPTPFWELIKILWSRLISKLVPKWMLRK